jgi:hypothetical protein
MIGLAESASGLAGGVYNEMNKKYPECIMTVTTRHPGNSAVFCEFKEPHSHATDHYILSPDSEHLNQRILSTETLILVDDEVTTGNTLKNLTTALMNSGMTSLKEVIYLSLTDWSAGARTKTIQGIPVHQFSLMEGTINWAANGHRFELPIHTNQKNSVCIDTELSRIHNWGRRWIESPPMINQETLTDIQNLIHKGQKILILGSGEYLYEPFTAARQLEREGHDVWFSSTTRSPAIPLMERTDVNSRPDRYGIKSKVVFPDLYKQNINNYLYNAINADWDRIILVTELPIDLASSSLAEVNTDLSIVSSFNYDQP